ncbi:hypothetical protein ACFYOK_37565 [Microbispora bryophytorum]|uniref:hypothetical protein n=1 Tax=Microbispora bryophytorum TaxID=1460882 RepID=UPI003410914A
MSLFARHNGRHVRRGSVTGWAMAARAYRDAAAHPVVNVAIACPVLAQPVRPGGEGR